MLPGLMARQTYTRKRYPRITDHGAHVVDYAGTAATAVYRGSIQPGTGDTDLTNRDGAEIVYSIYAPLSDDGKHDDVIVLDDGDYQVSGSPERWETGVLNHQVIRLARWNG